MAGSVRFAQRLLGVPGSGIREVMSRSQALKAAGADVINWHIGRPDFDTPQHIKEACTAAMAAGHVHYAAANGIPALREAIAAQAEREYGVSSGSIDPDRVVVCNGGMEAVTVTLHSILEPGDEVILPAPNWPNVKWGVALAGGVPIDVPLSEGVLTADAISAHVTGKTKAVVLSSPGNPLGTVTGKEELSRIAALAREKDLLVISDETYSRLYYGNEGAYAPSILSQQGMQARSVAVSTFSKTYAMDGWRLGWALCPTPAEATLVAKTRYYFSACSPTFTMHAAVTALTAPQDCVAEMVAQYDERRRIVVDGLAGIPGVKLPGGSPEGAFYVFPDISELGDSAEIAAWLLEKHHLAVIDGGVFGDKGRGHLRIAYACSSADCLRGVERLGSALRAWQK
eukprot:TRINITY_DN48075_c0_g1_i1.p1 TRINITY_DN48075_c0_g1~~TRINITY_DN48075_c0_g1_i1.p1  ORF type:complete len:399 (-),score=59.91 TRINITY_DN48075_c0_g1_i1:16-1212(-)